jgi:hypothetical protein
VCTFIGGVIVGCGPIHIGIVAGLIHAVIMYVLGLVGVFVMAYVIDYLAGTFDGQRNLDNAMRVSAYAPTAAWLAGVFSIIPFLGILGILGLSSIYLLHTGIVALMKPPESKTIIYTVVVIVCLLVVYLVIFGVRRAVRPRHGRRDGPYVILRQRLQMPDRTAGRDSLRGGDDGVGVDAVVAVQLGKRSGLAEMLDAERTRAVAGDRAEPG